MITKETVNGVEQDWLWLVYWDGSELHLIVKVKDGFDEVSKRTGIYKMPPEVAAFVGERKPERLLTTMKAAQCPEFFDSPELKPTRDALHALHLKVAK